MTTNKITEEFIERMGLSAQSDGLPRIAGRLFGFFIMEGGVHSFSEIAERLMVSRGSVSTNARILESLGILERITRPGDRQDYFQLSEDPYGKLLQGYVVRMRQNLDIVQRTTNKLSASNKNTHKRLQDMDRFYSTAIDNTLTILDSWTTSGKPGSKSKKS